MGIAVWPCSGIALAVILILGYRIWPGILLGAFLVNLTTEGSVATSAGIAIGNTLEGLAGAYLVSRLANGRHAMDRTADVFKFAILAGTLSTTIGATIGVTSLCLGGIASWANYEPVWMTWWLGDAAGVVIVAPLLLSKRGPEWSRTQAFEVVALSACLLLMSWVVFDGAVIPLLVCVVAVMTTATAAEVAERRRVEEEVRSLSTIDSLTGLGNYRKLIDTLESEVKRSNRTRRSFSLVLLDLDDLKKINDVHGHVTGNRALCRLADVLRVHCRSADTAARYGGDEFALVLPETEIEAARLIANRIVKQLANDPETPSVSVSVGVAAWPQDGATIEALLRAADDSLYEIKKSA